MVDILVGRAPMQYGYPEVIHSNRLKLGTNILQFVTSFNRCEFQSKTFRQVTGLSPDSVKLSF